MSTLSVKDLQELVELLRKSNTPSSKLTPPRVGGTTSTGAWTGFGTDGVCGAPRSSNCMRAFLADPLKSHTAMANIEAKCVAGLSDQSDLLFCMKDEPNAHKFVSSIRSFEEVMALVGMEATFVIISSDGTKLNMLLEPGRLTLSIVDQWIKDLTTGVSDFDSDGNLQPDPLDVCPYDQTNLRWSGTAVLNSCSDALKQDLKDLVPLKDQTGPKLFFHLLQKLYRPSQSKIRVLRSNLEGLTLTAYPGENVGLFCHDAAKIVREITMNFTKKDEIPDLTTSALKGLTYASDLLLCAKVRELRIANDVSGFTGAFGGTPVDAITALQEIEDLYDVLVAQSDYAPARPAPTSRAGVSMQGQALQQDRTSTTGSGGPSKPSNDSEITCWSCKQIGHRAGSDKCANYIGADKWTTTDKEAIKELISTKKASLPDRAHIPDSAEHSITYNNNVVAKCCRHCGRFVIGNNAHFTPGHRGGYKFAYKPTAVAPAAAPAPAAPAAPTPAIPAIPAAPTPAPIAANLGSVTIAGPPSGIPTISANQFASRTADYGLGSVTVSNDSDISDLIAWMGKD